MAFIKCYCHIFMSMKQEKKIIGLINQQFFFCRVKLQSQQEQTWTHLLHKRSQRLQSFLERPLTANMDSKTPADIIKEEVASYLAASGITVDGDPLTWWKSNECKYPHIAKMARCYLAVPGSSVPSERVVSTAGDIVTAKRSTLSPDNVDILVFLKKY